MSEDVDWMGVFFLAAVWLASIPMMVSLALDPHPYIEIPIEASALILGAWMLPAVVFVSIWISFKITPEKYAADSRSYQLVVWAKRVISR